MGATLEDMNIVLGALDSCKTKAEIVHNIKLPADIVDEVLETLRKLGKISKDDFTETYCPIERVADDMSKCCNLICSEMSA
jgi:hypothetical protein